MDNRLVSERLFPQPSQSQHGNPTAAPLRWPTQCSFYGLTSKLNLHSIILFRQCLHSSSDGRGTDNGWRLYWEEYGHVASKHRFTRRNRCYRQRVCCDNFKRRVRVFFEWNSHLATRCISRRRLPRWWLPGSLLSWRLPSWCGRCCRRRSILRATLRIYPQGPCC